MRQTHSPEFAMFVHDKINWNLRRLERHLEGRGDDPSIRTEYAMLCLSQAMFHDGGELWYNKSLTQARRVLQADPANITGFIVAGLALVGLDRFDNAARYLDEAIHLEPNRPLVRLAMGAMLWGDGSKHQAIQEFEAACQLAPKSWEAHFMLGRLLAEHCETRPHSVRLQERSRFHMVRALELKPSESVTNALYHTLALSCLAGERFEDAERLFNRLLEKKKYQVRARYFSGIVAYNLGKYKHAILHLRQHLEEKPDAFHVHSRIAMAYLQLGEITKTREACHRALAADPADLQARWTLASAWLSEEQIDEAVRLFKQILNDAPDHIEAFSELVHLHHEPRWLFSALQAEVRSFDSMPLSFKRERSNGRGHVLVNPQNTTLKRIKVLTAAIGRSEQEAFSCGQHGEAVKLLLETINLTRNEHLRFLLWTSALDQVAVNRARTTLDKLSDPGTYFSPAFGREVLILASVLPESLLTNALNIGEADLKRAAVDRHPPTRDVSTHRSNIEAERKNARAWQALLLLALARHQGKTGRNILIRWASDADPELADAARVALVLLGDSDGITALRLKARRFGQEPLVQALLNAHEPTTLHFKPRPVVGDHTIACSSCARTALDVDLLFQGKSATLCTECLTQVARDRAELIDPSQDEPCGLCGLGRHDLPEGAELFTAPALSICSPCMDHGLGLQEREAVDRFLTQC